MSETAVNSRHHWNKRFESDWESCGGRAQTRWFAELALANLEQPIVDDIRGSGLSICDWGCALGDAVELLAAAFPRSEITGVDFSSVALQRARKSAPTFSFQLAASPGDLGQHFGVVFTSNTMEHVSQPLHFLRELAVIADRYLVVLVPFDEFPRIDEHFNTFSHQSFPPVLKELRMVEFRVIDTGSIAGTVWQGWQILVVYAHKDLMLKLPLLDTEHEAAIRWTDFKGDEDPRTLIAESERLRCVLAKRSAALNMEVSGLEAKRALLLTDLDNLRIEHQTLQREHETLQRAHETSQLESGRKLADLEVALKRHECALNAISDNHLWKLVSGYDKVMSRVPQIRPYEIARRLRRLVNGSSAPPSRKTEVTPVDADFLRILKAQTQNLFFLFPPIIDWDIPLFQRPHHIALCLARQGYLYFFCTPNHAYDHICQLKEVIPNCFLTKDFEQLEHVELDTGMRKVVHVYSTDNMRDTRWIDHQLERGHTVLYEYVDEIHEDISGKPIPRLTYERHERILADERCFVVATATKLYEEVLRYRSVNCALISNGVDYDHFASANRAMGMPAELKPILAKRRPILGYYGALASWIDYDLIRHLATARPSLEIVLIGLDYDRSLEKSGIAKIENVTIFPPVAYSLLPRYGVWFDVCTIPFLVNQITLSTSPIKLFEYMALGKPIVTTALPECRKYESVLVAEDSADYIKSVDRALELVSDRDYLALLDKEARANTWEQKAGDILRLIQPWLDWPGENRST